MLGSELYQIYLAELTLVLMVQLDCKNPRSFGCYLQVEYFGVICKPGLTQV